MKRPLLAILAVLLASPLAARDSLGVFDNWGAFGDPSVPRCYAIAAADSGGSEYQAYADVGTWPRQGIRGQVHFRVSRELARGAHPSLLLGGARYPLTGGGADAWAQDKRTDAARQVTEYLGMVAVTFVVQYAFFWLAHERFGWPGWFSAGFANAAQMALSFVIMQRRVFAGAKAGPGGS